MDAEQINAYLKNHLDDFHSIVFNQEDVAYRTSMENLEFNDDLEVLVFIDKRNKFKWAVPYSQIEYVILETDQSHESMNNL